MVAGKHLDMLMKDNVRWIRENVPFMKYPEETDYIRRDRDRWRQRMVHISFLLRW